MRLFWAFALVTLCAVSAWCQSSGTINERRKKIQIRDAVCFVNPKKGEIRVLLFDRPLTQDQQADMMAWTGDIAFGKGEVGSLTFDYGKGGVASNPSLDDPRLKFVNLGTNPMFLEKVRSGFKTFQIGAQGCQIDLDFKGEFASEPLEYHLSLRAPVLLPQAPQAAPADLIKASQDYERALAKARSLEDLAPFYTSDFPAELAKLTSKEREGLFRMMTAFRSMPTGKKSYSIVRKSNWVELVISSTAGGATTSTRDRYVQEAGQWKLVPGGQ